MPEQVKRSIDMDSNDFKEIVREAVDAAVGRMNVGVSMCFAAGYEALGKALGGVSVSTLKKWKDAGRLDGAYKQVDRLLIFDVNKVFNVL